MPNLEPNFRFKLNGKTLVLIDWANVYGWQKSLGWEIDSVRLFDYLASYPEIRDKRFYFGLESSKQWSVDFTEKIKAIGFTLVSKEVKYVPVSLEKSHFRKIIKELFDVLDIIQTTNTEIATKLFDIKQRIENRLGDTAADYDSDGSVNGVFPAYHAEDESIYRSTYDLIEELDTELKKLNLSIADLQSHISEPVMRRKCDFDVELARDVFNLSNDFEQIILFSGDGDYAALVDDLIMKEKRVIVVFAPGHVGKEYKNQKGLFLCTVGNLKDEICTI